jgi:hypothetical protein
VATGQQERGEGAIARFPHGHDGASGVDVPALEITGRERFCVYVDQRGGWTTPRGQVSALLRSYNDRYSVEVSSPGLARPLRTREHFRGAEGRRVRVKTGTGAKVRGEVVTAGERSFQLVNGTGEPVDIPYDEVVRANLIDEG